MTAGRRLVIAVLVCGCGPAPAVVPPRAGTTMQASDDASAPTPQTVELTVIADAGVVGRVVLRVAQRGRDPVTVVLPDRADQIEWFDPDARGLVDPTLRVAWTAWRLDNGAGVDRGRSIAPTLTRRVTLGPDDVRQTQLDLAPAIAGLLLPDGATLGWCARAWLVGGAHPVASNIVCWREPDR